MINFQGWMSLIVGLTISTATAFAQPTSLEANREWVKTAVQDQLNRGQWEEALQTLQGHLKSDEKDSVAWAQVAFIQKYLNRCEDAQASLVRAANVGPLGQKEIYSTAADELRTKGCARGQSIAESERKWSSSAKLIVGYDTNVLLLSDALNVGTASEGTFFTPTANFSYRDQKDSGRLNVRSSTAYTAYTKTDLRSMESLNQSFVVEWEPGMSDSAWDRNYSNRFDIFFVNSDGLQFFSWTDMLRASFSRELNEKSRWGFDLMGGYQNYSAQTAPTTQDKRDGLLATPSIWYAKRLSQFVWTSALTYNQAFASGDNYKTQGATVSTGLSGLISDSVRARLNYAWTHTNYNQSTTGRKDDRSEVSVGLSRSFMQVPGANFSLDYFYTDNESNITGAGYRRSIVMGQVDYAF